MADLPRGVVNKSVARTFFADVPRYLAYISSLHGTAWDVPGARYICIRVWRPAAQLSQSLLPYGRMASRGALGLPTGTHCLLD
jgi:hypothetical protein